MANNIIYGQPYVEDSEENGDLIDRYENGDLFYEVNKDGTLKAAPETPKEENNEKHELKTESEDDPTSINVINESHLPYCNFRALSRYASTYELEKFEKKVLLIFNQENVDGYKRRLGTDKDVEALTRTFERVDFQVTEYKDFTKTQILNQLRIFFDQDFTDVGCIAIAVLTHGNEYGMLRAKDRAYNETEITEYLESLANPTLLTKPKLLIVQACRGTKSNIAVTVRAAFGTTHKDLIEDVTPYTMPREADQLILHSTYGGNPSFRNTVDGSWLIQSLCKHIDALAHTTDLESIIVAVKREVAIDRFHEEYNRRTNDIEINKQIPVMTSTLIRKLYLKKFGEVTESNLNSMMLFTNYDAQDSTTSAPETSSVTQTETAIPVASMPRQMHVSSKQYFVYLVKCLGYYLEDNPEDTIAQSFLQVSKTFGKGKKFDAAKEEMISVLCKYFGSNEDKILFFKYLFIKKK